jgi:tetratricopeptide (TPR) repeat protein
MLEQNPCHPQALVGITLVALASGQSAAAVTMAEAAVAAAPQMGAAWVALGQALQAVNRPEEAERAYRQASCFGMDTLARMGLGELRIAANRPQEAIGEFERVLQRQPLMIAAQMGIGHALAMLGNHEEALARYDLTLTIRPNLPEAEFACGYVLARLGRTKEAEDRYRRALVARPDFAAAWINLGALQREQGREVYAEAAFRRAIELRPDLISAWVNLALLKREQRYTSEAEALLRRAFALNPQQVETLIAWCQFRAAEQDLSGAWQWLRWALMREPQNAEAVNMHGILLHQEKSLEEAIAVFEHAEQLGHPTAASNRGNSLIDLGRLEEGLHAQELATERDPFSPGARYNLALTRLRMGDWLQGWPQYEARWSFREVHRNPRFFAQPRWQGDALHGRRILLHAEQGLGDTIQFCRYVNMVAARGGRVILQVQKPTLGLMRSLTAVRTEAAEVALLGDALPEFDCECPLMSLPAVFGTTIESVPWPEADWGAYLEADPALTHKKWMEFPILKSSRRSLRIGVAWAGNPNYKADRMRSVQLRTLLPLLRMPGVTWIALQKGPSAEELATLPSDAPVLDGSSRDLDLAETAALVATLDLVITTDTCIAHLAGSMAKPVWILLPYLADWRWMQQTETTPWYPTARLFRQIAPGDWEGVLHRVCEEIDRINHSNVLQIRKIPTKSSKDTALFTA